MYRMGFDLVCFFVGSRISIFVAEYFFVLYLILKKLETWQHCYEENNDAS